jgi:hypothetical protein
MSARGVLSLRSACDRLRFARLNPTHQGAPFTGYPSVADGRLATEAAPRRCSRRPHPWDGPGTSRQGTAPAAYVELLHPTDAGILRMPADGAHIVAAVRRYPERCRGSGHRHRPCPWPQQLQPSGRPPPAGPLTGSSPPPAMAQVRGQRRGLQGRTGGRSWRRGVDARRPVPGRGAPSAAIGWEWTGTGCLRAARIRAGPLVPSGRS